MKFVSALLVVFFALLAEAQVRFTNSAFNPVAGQTFELTWSDNTGPVTITLKTGPAEDLDTVSVVASGLTGTSYDWSVPTNLPSGTYALEISDTSGGPPNYSLQFPLTGTGVPSVSSTVASTTSAPVRTTTTSSSVAPSTTSTSKSETESKSSSLSTSTRATTSRTTSASPSSTSAETTANIPGAAGRLASPLALIMVTIAAMVYLN